MSESAGKRIIDDYAAEFGAIISRYVELETVVKLVLAAYLNMDSRLCFIVMEPYSSRHLHDVVLALCKGDFEKAPGPRLLVEAVEALSRFSKTRNAIAHWDWRPGTRPGSIKPIIWRLSGGRGKALGIYDDDPDFLPEDFAKEAEEMVSWVRKLNTMHAAIMKKNPTPPWSGGTLPTNA